MEACVVRHHDRFGVLIKQSKCPLIQCEVEYFAFKVNKDGIHPSSSKWKEAIPEFPEPSNKRELRPWLGIVN